MPFLTLMQQVYGNAIIYICLQSTVCQPLNDAVQSYIVQPIWFGTVRQKKGHLLCVSYKRKLQDINWITSVVYVTKSTNMYGEQMAGP